VLLSVALPNVVMQPQHLAAKCGWLLCGTQVLLCQGMCMELHPATCSARYAHVMHHTYSLARSDCQNLYACPDPLLPLQVYDQKYTLLLDGGPHRELWAINAKVGQQQVHTIVRCPCHLQGAVHHWSTGNAPSGTMQCCFSWCACCSR
jgi:hypothetical protein